MNETQKAQYIAQRNLKPYNGDLSYIFISYSHLDWLDAMLIIERLMRDGYRVWFDEGIDPGTEWGENIAGHVGHCEVFIALISQNYLNSDNCLNELDYSREKEKPRLLIYLENVKLSEALVMQHGRYQAVHKYIYQKEDDFYIKLEGKILEACHDRSTGIITTDDVDVQDQKSLGQHGKFPVKPVAIAAIVVAGVFAAIMLLTGRSGSGDSGTDDSVAEEDAENSEDGEGTTEEEQLAEDDDSGEAVEELAEETIEEEIVAIRTGDSETEEDEQEADETLDESEDADLSEADAVLISEDGYILKAEAISEETIEQLQAQVEDSFYAYVAEEWDRETMTLRGMDYLGYYFLAEKYSSDPQNMIYLVYKVTLEYYVETNPLISDELITYYYYVGFSDLLVLYNGLISLDYSKTYETENTFSENDFTYYGYQELEDLYIDVVTVHMGSYSYESTVEDQDFGYEISILSYGPDEDDFEYNGHYYRVFETQMSWADAEAFCEELGGHLVTITSQEENDAIMDLLSDHTTGSYIIGLYRDTDEFEIWVTGEKLEYTNWGDGEPDNLSGDQRLGVIANEILTGSGYSISYGEWDDLGDLGCYFICEWDGITGEEAEVSDPVEMQIPTDALVYNGHSYYLFDDVCDSWVEAKEYCESLGGHLAYIKDSVTDKTLHSYIRMLGYKSAFFGLRYSVVHGWIWDDGTTLSYENWAVDEPSGDGVYGMYYEEFTDGGWNDGTFGFDADCFICEWDGV